jgi:hypothetical protein
MEVESAAMRKQLLDAVASQGPEFAKLAALLENADRSIEVPDGLISEEVLEKGFKGIAARIRKNSNGHAE